MKEQKKIAIIGLGYVGLPLAVEFGKAMPTLGYDINKCRIEELLDGKDNTREVLEDSLAQATQLQFSNDASDLDHYNTFIVTVPTPIDDAKRINLSMDESEQLHPEQSTTAIVSLHSKAKYFSA